MSSVAVDITNVTSVFKCLICMETVKDALMCVHCSLLSCNLCITEWAWKKGVDDEGINSVCPQCRGNLFNGDLVSCTWAEKVGYFLDSVQQGGNLTPEQGANEDPGESIQSPEACDLHYGEKCSVFCVECDKGICYRCALWGKDHQGHTLKPMKEVAHEVCQKLREYLITLRIRSLQIQNSIKDTEENISVLANALDQMKCQTNDADAGSSSLKKSQLRCVKSVKKNEKKLELLCSQKELLYQKLNTITTVIVKATKTIEQKVGTNMICDSGALFAEIENSITEKIKTVHVSPEYDADGGDEDVDESQSTQPRVVFEEIHSQSGDGERDSASSDSGSSTFSRNSSITSSTIGRRYSDCPLTDTDDD